jgi:hypothetical protein
MSKREIDFVQGEAVEVRVDGTDVTVAPLVVQQWPKALRLIEPIMGTLLYEADTLNLSGVLMLLGVHGEPLIEAVAIFIKQPLEWVGQLLPDRLAALVMIAIEVNGDFFTKAMAAMQAQAPSIAPTLAAKIMANPAISAGLKPSTS